MNIEQQVIKLWYQTKHHWLNYLLSPLSLLFGIIVFWRRKFYQWGMFKQTRLRVPVIVVGNINIGGSGKTPMVIWLVRYLQEQGYRPGVIMRGYKGKHNQQAVLLNQHENIKTVGDEAILLYQALSCPIVVAANRVQAGNYLLEKTDCDIIISDDGLQHYALARDVELVLVDAARGFGNRALLPAGPLREPITRLATVDFVIGKNGQPPVADSIPSAQMQLKPVRLRALKGEQSLPIEHFSNQVVHAVAAIGQPQSFFELLRAQSYRVYEHPLPDHHFYTKKDFQFMDKHPIIITAKDAVKCTQLEIDNVWVFEVGAELDIDFSQKLLDCLKRKRHG